MRPVHPTHPIVPVPALSVIVTLLIQRATPAFTFSLTIKTLGAAATPLVVVEFAPVALPHGTVPTVVRPPAKKFVQNNAAAVSTTAETSASAAPATAEPVSSGMAAPVAVGALIAAAVEAVISLRRRRPSCAQPCVRTDDHEGNRAHDDAALPLV